MRSVSKYYVISIWNCTTEDQCDQLYQLYQLYQIFQLLIEPHIKVRRLTMPKERKRDTEQIDAIGTNKRKQRNPMKAIRKEVIPKKIKKASEKNSDSDCEITCVENLALPKQYKDLPRKSNSVLSQSMTSKASSTAAEAGPSTSRVNRTDVNAGPSTSRVNRTDTNAGPANSRTNSTGVYAGPATSYSDDIIIIHSHEEQSADAAPLDLTQETNPVAHGTSTQNEQQDLVTINNQTERDIEIINKLSLSEINQRGVCILKNFMEEKVVKQIWEEVQQMESDGCFRAGVLPPSDYPLVSDPAHQVYTIKKRSPGNTAIYELARNLRFVVGWYAWAQKRDIKLGWSEVGY